VSEDLVHWRECPRTLRSGGGNELAAAAKDETAGTVGGKTYHGFQPRGAGGQFIFMFPELDLIAVITSHNKGMGDTLKTLPERIIPAFVPCR
jgi:hypothetical protein